MANRYSARQASTIELESEAFHFDFSSLESLPADHNPELTSILTSRYWNHFAIQLGHWNAMKVIIMDSEMFTLMPDHTKFGVLNMMKNFLAADAMYARDADNGHVIILGPRSVMEGSITIVDETAVWDPKKKHLPVIVEEKIRRPPNAYILYRRDRQAYVKASNPSLHNNDISVITGAMWKNESDDVRQYYQTMANKLKDNHMTTHPGYRYVPRKSSEIRRRAARRLRDENSASEQEPVLLRQRGNTSMVIQQLNEQGIRLNSQITQLLPSAQKFLPPLTQPGWTPIHLVPDEMQAAAAAALGSPELVPEVPDLLDTDVGTLTGQLDWTAALDPQMTNEELERIIAGQF
ncbi:MAT+ sexual cell fertilization-promoting factor encoded by the FPR1 protein [Podospora australis]|uniref:MAT+ sexual cell fertilization-promoting factor encoded by the FPR1 protein n=1 Tax=Podospora australis TaxID=1536484 RepID=A0AAN6WMW2_9PEZI|nr:MAT+ sexual cell fertilization-promoting factor encoded by the FPR1 protein [Podospora australis]